MPWTGKGDEAFPFGDVVRVAKSLTRRQYQSMRFKPWVILIAGMCFSAGLIQGVGGDLQTHPVQVPSKNKMPPEKLMAILESSRADEITVVDVREDWEHQAVRIKGSLHIPWKKIKAQSGQLNPKGTIVLYCSTYVRSSRAWNELNKLGFKDIHILDGGMEGWIDIRGLVETPRAIPWQEGKGCES